MKSPNLSYNHFYPFYTQNTFGKKKGFYGIYTTMHLAEDKGFYISLSYNKGKFTELQIEVINDSSRLYKKRMDDNYISYVDFAKVIKTIYLKLSKAVRELSSEPAYKEVMIYRSSYIKYNHHLELLMDYKSISIKYGEINYRIENGKRIKIEKESDIKFDTNSEEGRLLSNLAIVANAYNDQRNYTEIDHEEFNEKLNRNWEDFIPYFEAPKFIKKSEYVIKTSNYR